jgi:hypothetical protein
MPPVRVDRPGPANQKPNNNSLSPIDKKLLKSRSNLKSRIVLLAMSAFLILCFGMEERKDRYGT